MPHKKTPDSEKKDANPEKSSVGAKTPQTLDSIGFAVFYTYLRMVGAEGFEPITATHPLAL
jgi:hypothetical protein